ncbi:hypothetical protein BNJ_00331 [Kaumoebavirus]|uniref:hypothetical protein n=1 Tax=Kaumoebavirus TaxID=1859492 RepID=UPI0009C26674|nr:hypothetical protein BNJ_00331 [Kaumoebavirus]ARA72151.1 hypothetical protein BNJ_00331 [Kaumoebavirus]
MSIHLYQHFRVLWGETEIICETVFRKEKEDMVYRQKTIEGVRNNKDYELTPEERKGKSKIILHYQPRGYSWVAVQMCNVFDKIISGILGAKIYAYLYNYQDIKKKFKISSYCIGEVLKITIPIQPIHVEGRPTIAHQNQTFYIEDDELTCDDE